MTDDELTQVLGAIDEIAAKAHRAASAVGDQAHMRHQRMTSRREGRGDTTGIRKIQGAD